MDKIEQNIREEIEKGIGRNKVLPLDWAMDRIRPILKGYKQETKKEILDKIKIFLNKGVTCSKKAQEYLEKELLNEKTKVF